MSTSVGVDVLKQALDTERSLVNILREAPMRFPLPDRVVTGAWRVRSQADRIQHYLTAREREDEAH